MANIVLKTFKGGNVTPQDDAIIYQTAVPGAGIFKGCEVSYARGNVLHISQGFGMIKGRFFEVYETEIAVQLAETGSTLNGRLYIHLDLSNTDEPITILSETAKELSALASDANINYNNTSYDLELAVFDVDSSSIRNLAQTFSTLQGGSSSSVSGGTGLSRETSYDLGDTASSANAPGWCTLVCVQAGTTATSEPSGYAQITKSGDRVLDGSCVFEARNTYGELDDLGKELDDLTSSVETLAGQLSDTGNMVFKLVSLSDYQNLEEYDSNCMYYCYEDEEAKQITRIYLGENPVYATGISVTYSIDTDYSLTQMYTLSSDAVASAPPVTKEGYTFVGWRNDADPGSKVLDKYVLDTDDPVTLYAVFRRNIMIDMAPNGADVPEDAEETEMEAVLYYNNGAARSEEVLIPACPYTKEDKSFVGWNTDFSSDAVYFPEEKGTFSDDSTLYPVFIDTVYDFPYTGNYTPFTIPADGIYEFELWGGKGADATGTITLDGTAQSVTGKGGKGGHVKAYAKMKKGTVLYIYNGGGAKGVNSGANNYGGEGNSYSSSKHIGAGGGGATHVAKDSGSLGSNSLSYAKRSSIYLIAGGGGGGGVSSSTGNDSSDATRNYTIGAHDGGDGGGERGGNGNSGVLGGRQVSTGSTESTNFGYTSYSGNTSSVTYSGGGAGWFGGGFGVYGNSGAGGSGYVGGMPAFTYKKKYYGTVNEAGVNDGDGYSFIRYVTCCKVS